MAETPTCQSKFFYDKFPSAPNLNTAIHSMSSRKKIAKKSKPNLSISPSVFPSPMHSSKKKPKPTYSLSGYDNAHMMGQYISPFSVFTATSSQPDQTCYCFDEPCISNFDYEARTNPAYIQRWPELVEAKSLGPLLDTNDQKCPEYASNQLLNTKVNTDSNPEARDRPAAILPEVTESVQTRSSPFFKATIPYTHSDFMDFNVKPRRYSMDSVTSASLKKENLGQLVSMLISRISSFQKSEEKLAAFGSLCTYFRNINQIVIQHCKKCCPHQQTETQQAPTFLSKPETIQSIFKAIPLYSPFSTGLDIHLNYFRGISY